MRISCEEEVLTRNPEYAEYQQHVLSADPLRLLRSRVDELRHGRRRSVWARALPFLLVLPLVVGPVVAYFALSEQSRGRACQLQRDLEA